MIPRGPSWSSLCRAAEAPPTHVCDVSPHACCFAPALSSAALATPAETAPKWDSNITIGPDEEVSDATCFGCSIRVRGHVSGDVTAFGGSIVVEDQGQVGGDATAFGGDVRLDKEVKVARRRHGIRRPDSAAIPRPQSPAMSPTMGGRGWMLLIVLAPFIILGLFVAFVVWLIRRLIAAVGASHGIRRSLRIGSLYQRRVPKRLTHSHRHVSSPGAVVAKIGNAQVCIARAQPIEQEVLRHAKLESLVDVDAAPQECSIPIASGDQV